MPIGVQRVWTAGRASERLLAWKGSMTTDSSEGLAVLTYLAVASRWKWLIIGITSACLAAGFAYLVFTTPLYSATTKLLYAQPVTISNPLIQGSYSQTYQQPDISTISAMVTSSQVTTAALELLKGKAQSADYWVEVSQPSGSYSGSGANVVDIEAVSPSPQIAADAANATAQAFVDWRRQTKSSQVQSALAAVKAALKTYTSASAKESAEYLQLKQSEQALELQLESLSSDFTIMTMATVPAAPFSPRTRHTLALAGSLGLILALVVAFLLEQLDTRVRDERQMADMLGLSSLGHLPPLRRRSPDGAGVHMLTDPSGPMAEGIRVLRGNLGFTGVDGDVRSILVTSSIRSEGKSVTACNLAVSLALAGQKVVLIDADLRRPRVHNYMRISNAVGLSSVLARQTELQDALIQFALEGQEAGEGGATLSEARKPGGAPVRTASMIAGGSRPVVQLSSRRSGDVSRADTEAWLQVLPSGPLPPNPGEMAASQRLGEIIGHFAQSADLVIVDTPPLLEVGDAAAMASSIDGLVFVANMGRVRWPMLERSRSQLEKFPCRKLGMVIIAGKQVRRSSYGYEYRYGSRLGGASSSGHH